MAKSHYQQENYASTDFLESAGTILFDFRNTGIDPYALAPQSQSQPQHHHHDHQPNDSNTTAVTDTTTTETNPEPKIIFFHLNAENRTLLPKGRRNVSEPRYMTALRETREETGLRCSLLPVTLHSRATSSDPARDNTNALGYTVNEVRTFPGCVTDPFMLTVRHVRVGQDRSEPQIQDGDGDEVRKKGHVKLIWWFVAVVDEVQDETPTEIDPGCEVRSFGIRDAVVAPTYEDDRAVVRKAKAIVEETLGLSWD